MFWSSGNKKCNGQASKTLSIFYIFPRNRLLIIWLCTSVMTLIVVWVHYKYICVLLDNNQLHHSVLVEHSLCNSYLKQVFKLNVFVYGEISVAIKITLLNKYHWITHVPCGVMFKWDVIFIDIDTELQIEMYFSISASCCD